VPEKQTKKKGKLMKNIDSRAKYDDFELEDNYDFTDGIRGKFYKPEKISVSMKLDNDILIFLKKQASEKKIAYQTLINSLLRDYMKVIGLSKQKVN
jgi:predicted DNA binding CopG/RHH family protein